MIAKYRSRAYRDAQIFGDTIWRNEDGLMEMVVRSQGRNNIVSATSRGKEIRSTPMMAHTPGC
ncbi:MAG: hypothetical protein IPN60_19065 [Saprospiraceae bacterium]|nr:hypothetical protein [Candidatus Opimibacter skivensis]